MTVNATSPLAETSNLTAYRAAGGDASSAANQAILADLVRRNVQNCVSCLVTDLSRFENGTCYDEVLDLCAPRSSYRDALDEAGATDADWLDVCESLNIEAEVNGEGARGVEAQGRALELVRDWASDEDEARRACDLAGLDPVESEIYEYWTVDRWFAGKLAELGEATGGIYHLHVWGRTCTGQAIFMDSVIAEIGAGMEILTGQRNDWSRK